MAIVQTFMGTSRYITPGVYNSPLVPTVRSNNVLGNKQYSHEDLQHMVFALKSFAKLFDGMPVACGIGAATYYGDDNYIYKVWWEEMRGNRWFTSWVEREESSEHET